MPGPPSPASKNQSSDGRTPNALPKRYSASRRIGVRITSPDRRPLMRLGSLLPAVALLLSPLAVQAAPFPAPAKGKSVDLVLCLDTSNSMDGLIDSAKRKLWAV